MDRHTNRSRSGWSRSYRRLAVVEIDDAYFAVQRMKAALLSGAKGPHEPAQIRRGAKGLVRIIETWEHLNVGLTARSAYRRAMVEARALRDRLNAEEAHAHYFAELRLDREFA